jgi:predicted P-loop ATPase
VSALREKLEAAERGREPRNTNAEPAITSIADVMARIGPVQNAQRRIDGDGRLDSDLIKTKHGKPENCGSNIALILSEGNELGGRLRWNELTKAVEVTAGTFAGLAPSDLQTAVKNWLETRWAVAKPAKTEVGDQLLYVARQNRYNPVAEYLNSLAWDGVPRIGGYSILDGVSVHSGWLSTYCGSPEDEHTSRVGGMFLVGAVARALDPGCKHDVVLTLIGRQGAKKSTALRILAGEWFTDTPIKLGEKDGYMVAASTWFVELAELASLKSAEEAYEKHKAFLSSASDMYRPPYAPALERFPRRCIFAGTTNAEEYLADPTGNRRHWSAWVERVDVDTLERDRDQLWAEAVHRYRAGLAHKATERPVHARWWLEPDEQCVADDANRAREGHDAWSELIGEWAGKQAQLKEHASPGFKGWTTAHIAWEVLRIDARDLDRAKQNRIADACRGAGLVKSKHQVWIGGECGPRRWRPRATRDGRD